MNHTVAVIVPLYKTRLSPSEEISICQCFKILSKYKIIAVKPQSLSLNEYKFKFDEELSFNDSFFADITGYNQLLLSAEFYQKFLNYKYILIYQPDAFVFSDDLLYWCNKGYDYIGAPWLKPQGYSNMFKEIIGEARNYIQIRWNIKQSGTGIPTDQQTENRVGNGGFSLRNTEKFHVMCTHHKELIDFYNSRPEHNFNEDVFWSIEVNRRNKLLNIPGYKQAVHFSIEKSFEHAFRLTHGKLPFGCHAWDRNSEFWKPVFRTIGVDISEIRTV